MNEKDLELYQDYILGELSAEQTKVFEQRLSDDLEFAKGFEEFRQLEADIAEVFNIQAAKEVIKNLIDFDQPLDIDEDEEVIIEKPENRFKIKPLFLTLSIAASVALIAVVSFFFWQKEGPTKPTIVNQIDSLDNAIVKDEIEVLDTPALPQQKENEVIAETTVKSPTGDGKILEQRKTLDRLLAQRDSIERVVAALEEQSKYKLDDGTVIEVELVGLNKSKEELEKLEKEIAALKKKLKK